MIFASLGYALFGLFYVAGGIHHFTSLSFFAQMLDKRRIPLPKPVLVIGSLFQIIAGSLLALQVATHTAAIGLAVFTVISSLMLLDFWRWLGIESSIVEMKSRRSSAAPPFASRRQQRPTRWPFPRIVRA